MTPPWSLSIDFVAWLWARSCGNSAFQGKLTATEAKSSILFCLSTTIFGLYIINSVLSLKSNTTVLQNQDYVRFYIKYRTYLIGLLETHCAMAK